MNFKRLVKSIIKHPGHKKAAHYALSLKLLVDRTQEIGKSDLLLFCTCRNECARLPFFLDYYRKLGVDRFLFVDDDSSDGSVEFLSSQPDVSLWTTKASYREANFGVHWLNFLLRKYGSGHWCLTLDPDEFLVIPHHGSRDLKELCAFLDSNKKESFFSIMIDMYPRGDVDLAVYNSGQDPLDVAPWFDPTGYYQERRPQGECWIRGGVRRRVFFTENPEDAPALNKTVLVKWRKRYLYLASAHLLSPFRLNEPHFPESLAPTGCLLHFKYLSLFLDKVQEELVRKQHYADSREYKRYADLLGTQTPMWCEGSVKYERWEQFVDLGLMNTGRWF